ncbi:MAG: hypothetical protein AB8B53_03570 [Flavobacteriales bacterium]
MKTIIIVFCLSLLAITSLEATVWRVNNNLNYIQGDGGPCGEADVCEHCFSDLQAAIDCNQVFPGDTLYLEASLNDYGDMLVNKRLVIIGAGFFLSENPGSQSTASKSRVGRIDFSVSGSTIAGLTQDVSTTSGYNVQFVNGSDDISITRCYFLTSIEFGNDISVENVNITKNYIEGSIYNSSVSGNDGVLANIIISNNFVGGNIKFYNLSSGTITQNVIEGNVTLTSGFSAFYNNILTAPNLTFLGSGAVISGVYNNVFVDPDVSPDLIGAENSFDNPLSSIFNTTGSEEDLITTLPFCTVCQSGYVAGSENNALMGVYGGLDPYVRAGLPDIPSIYFLGNTSASFSGGTIDVEIHSKSNN